jgi:hypothetical protein
MPCRRACGCLNEPSSEQMKFIERRPFAYPDAAA